MNAKIVKESLKSADNGRVEVMLKDDTRIVQGYIEQTFFEDAFGNTTVNPQQKMQFTTQNIDYLENAFQKLLEENANELIIR